MVNYVLASHRGRLHILTKAHEPSAYGGRTFLESRVPTLTSSGWASEYCTSRWRSLVASTAQWVNSDDQQRPGREGPGEGLVRILLGPALAVSVRAEVVSDLRRATSVQHHRRTEPSATNAANARSPQNQRNLALTSTANDGWKTFTRQGSTGSIPVSPTLTVPLLGFFR